MQGRTSLMLATENRRAAIVKTLVLEGANVHIRDQEVHEQSYNVNSHCHVFPATE